MTVTPKLGRRSAGTEISKTTDDTGFLEAKPYRYPTCFLLRDRQIRDWNQAPRNPNSHYHIISKLVDFAANAGSRQARIRLDSARYTVTEVRPLEGSIWDKRPSVSALAETDLCSTNKDGTPGAPVAVRNDLSTIMVNSRTARTQRMSAVWRTAIRGELRGRISR